VTPTELSTNSADLKDVGSTVNRRRERLMKLILVLAGVAFGAAVFLTLDWFHSAKIQRNSKATASPDPCRVRDPVRHHSFKPNCSSIEYWGTEKYKFFTNSLGFRDEKIREVPLADPRPRILILGDSFTEGMIAWRDSYVGRIADHFPQDDFLNGGVVGYSPSNYLNTTRILLAAGVQFDEVIVFVDNSTVAQEAAFYRDVDASGAVAGPERIGSAGSQYVKWRRQLATHFVLTYHVLRLLDRFQRLLVRHGYYHLPATEFGDPFDAEISAWTYRKVNETDPYPAGYAPLGVEGGIAKGKAKMTLLWEELEKRNIPISVVVYPHLAQLVHDNADSRQVRMWREWCEGKCKRFISLFPAFLAVEDQCPRTQPGCWYPSLFVYGDMHFAAGGNALVAGAVIKSLAEEPPVKRPGTNLQLASGPGFGRSLTLRLCLGNS
jgi:hypothetical protein